MHQGWWDLERRRKRRAITVAVARELAGPLLETREPWSSHKLSWARTRERAGDHTRGATAPLLRASPTGRRSSLDGGNASDRTAGHAGPTRGCLSDGRVDASRRGPAQPNKGPHIPSLL